MEANELKKADREYEIARQSFENQRIKAVKGSKRPTAVYKTLDSFYDHKARVEEIKNTFRKEEKQEKKGLNFEELIRHKRQKEMEI